MDQTEIDRVCTLLNLGRKAMRDAFAALSGLACRAGVDENVVVDLHGQFFDGSDQLKAQVKALALLARLNGGS